jgi:hypothetical protein
MILMDQYTLNYVMLCYVMLCGQIISGSCLFFTEIAFCISILDHTNIILQSYSKVPIHIYRFMGNEAPE